MTKVQHIGANEQPLLNGISQNATEARSLITYTLNTEELNDGKESIPGAAQTQLPEDIITESFTVESRQRVCIPCQPMQKQFAAYLIEHVTALVDNQVVEKEYTGAGWLGNFTPYESKEIDRLIATYWESYLLNYTVMTQAFLKRVGLTGAFDQRAGIIADGMTPYTAAPLIDAMVPMIDTSYITKSF